MCAWRAAFQHVSELQGDTWAAIVSPQGGHSRPGRNGEHTLTLRLLGLPTKERFLTMGPWGF